MSPFGFGRRGHEARDAIAALGVPTFSAARPRLKAELARARRYERTVTVLAIGPRPRVNTGGNSSNGSAALARVDLAAFVLLGGLLREETRETDIVTQLVRVNRFAVVLPEDDEDGAMALARRLARAFDQLAAMDLLAGAAAFPRDGFTIKDLLGRALQTADDGLVPLSDDPPRTMLLDA